MAFPPPNAQYTGSDYATRYGTHPYNWCGWGYAQWGVDVWGQECNDLVHRSHTSTVEETDIAHRSASDSIYEFDWVHRSSTVDAFFDVYHRASCLSQGIVRDHLHRARALSQQITRTYHVAPGYTSGSETASEYDFAWKTGVGELTGCTFSPGGPVALDPAGITVTLNESAPAQWEIPIQSPRSQHSPLNQISGWGNILKMCQTMTANLVWGGMPFDFVGISNGMAQTRPGFPSRMMSLTWRGICQAGFRLNDPHKTEITFRDRMASAIVASILQTAGVTSYNLNQLLADDWLVPVFHRQNGKPIDWIVEILTIACLEWRIDGGNTFVVYLPDSQGGSPGTATWTYDATCVVHDASEDISIADVYSRAIVRRAVEAGEVQEAPPAKFTDMSVAAADRETVALDQSNPTATECHTFGEYTVEFTPPLNAVHWRVVAAEGGEFSDFRCYTPTSGAQPAAVRDPRGPTTIPQSSVGFGFQLPPTGTAGLYPPSLLANGALNNISKIVFTWGEAPGNAIVTTDITGTVSVVQDNEVLGGYGRIEFLGTKGGGTPVSGLSGDAGSGQQYDDTLFVTVNDATNLAFLNGIVRQTELQLSALFSLADATRIMTRYGERWLRRFGRELRQSALKMALNPMMAPGDVIHLVEDDLGITRHLLVKSPTHVFATGAARGTSVRTAEYLA